MSNYYAVPKGDQITISWGDEARDVVFGGISWSGHLMDLESCHASDTRIVELENELAGERAVRDQNRVKLAEANRKVYYGVLAHPDFGDDCSLLARMGYTRRSDQDSGLTRAAHELPPSGILN